MDEVVYVQEQCKHQRLRQVGQKVYLCPLPSPSLKFGMDGVARGVAEQAAVTL